MLTRSAGHDSAFCPMHVWCTLLKSSRTLEPRFTWRFRLLVDGPILQDPPSALEALEADAVNAPVRESST